MYKYWNLCINNISFMSMKDNLELKNYSTIGVFITLFILFVVIIQSPFYFIEYLEEFKKEDKNTHLSLINLTFTIM